MTIVSVSEAARLSGRGRATLYRLFERGELSRSVSPDGSVGVDVSELIRVFGQLKAPKALRNAETLSQSVSELSAETVTTVPELDPVVLATAKAAQALETDSETADIPVLTKRTGADSSVVVALQEKIASYEKQVALLQRIADLEREVRRETAAALKSQLESKDAMIQTLERQVLMLTYTKQEEPTAPIEQTDLPVGWKKLLSRLFKAS